MKNWKILLRLVIRALFSVDVWCNVGMFMGVIYSFRFYLHGNTDKGIYWLLAVIIFCLFSIRDLSKK